MSERKHAVTGAFGYSGRFIARKLIEEGNEVVTLTNRPEARNPFGDKLAAYPYDFDEPERMAKSLKGVSVLYNTYWVRFNDGSATRFSTAFKNSLALFKAAKAAEVDRIVHISITNPDRKSKIAYFREKAELEDKLKGLEVPHSILRPAVLFGDDDVLINNIAWALRRLPVFGIFGDGSYPIQPIHVEDLADLAVAEGRQSGMRTIDAVGPEKFQYRDMVVEIAKAIGKQRFLMSVPPYIGYLAARMIGLLVGDVMMRREEVEALIQGRLAVNSEPTGKIKLSEWMRENSSGLGKTYAKGGTRKKR